MLFLLSECLEGVLWSNFDFLEWNAKSVGRVQQVLYALNDINSSWMQGCYGICLNLARMLDGMARMLIGLRCAWLCIEINITLL